MDMDKVIEYYKKEEGISKENDISRLKNRAECAKNWLEKYAPEDFRFSVNEKIPEDIQLDENLKEVFKEILKRIDDERYDDEKELHNFFYETCNAKGADMKEFFKTSYMILISKQRGPRLAGFILTIGKHRFKDLIKEII
jgi:lysyl-tRNA synthetase class 1